MFKFSFKKNSSICLVQPNFNIIKYGEGRCTTSRSDELEWTGVKDKSCMNNCDQLHIFEMSQTVKSGIFLKSSNCCLFVFDSSVHILSIKMFIVRLLQFAIVIYKIKCFKTHVKHCIYANVMPLEKYQKNANVNQTVMGCRMTLKRIPNVMYVLSVHFGGKEKK
jgi:hypothetical protein